MGIEVKRDQKGVWFAQPYLGKAPDGRQIRPRRSFPDATTREEAQALADAWASHLTFDGKVKSTLIVDLLWEYIEQRKVKGAGLNTVKRWSLFTRTYVGKYLKGKVARDLTAIELNDFETRLGVSKKNGGQGLSRNTIISVHHFLRGAYNFWVRIGICENNPMLMVAKPPEERHEAVSIDEWDYRALDATVSEKLDLEMPEKRFMRQSAYAFAAWLALHTGMRVGEVCAVRRRDLHKAQGFILVSGTVIEVPGGGVIRSNVTKNKKTRPVALIDEEWERIKAYLAQQDSISDAFTPDSPLVSIDGSYMRPTTVSKAFSRARDRAGMPKAYTFHSLRHTHATWCLANGVDLKTLADRLGHSNEATTLKLYAHLLPGRDQAAAQAFNSFAKQLEDGV